MRKLLIAFIVCCMMPSFANGQEAGQKAAKKPSVMVVPSLPWCKEHGYVTTVTQQGVTKEFPDYAKAAGDADLFAVITKLGELMAERGLVLKDYAAAARNAEQLTLETEMLVSGSSGASIVESPMDRLLNVAKADILVEVGWVINTVGPKHSITYNLRGIDAYTSNQVAAAQGTGEQSFSAEVPVLLEEAVIVNIDQFASQMQMHFDDLLSNGRSVSIVIQTFDNDEGINLETEFDGMELQEIIDEWMAENTVQGRYSLDVATESTMLFNNVRIPLFKANGASMDTRAFVSELRRMLRKEPYNIQSKLIATGLGRARLTIGEK